MALAEDDELKQKGVVVYGVAQKDFSENVRRFLGADGNPYARVGLDPDGRAGIDWGVYGVPETFIVKGDGTIAYKVVGPITAETLESEVKPQILKALIPSGSSDPRVRNKCAAPEVARFAPGRPAAPPGEQRSSDGRRLRAIQPAETRRQHPAGARPASRRNRMVDGDAGGHRRRGGALFHQGASASHRDGLCRRGDAVAARPQTSRPVARPGS